MQLFREGNRDRGALGHSFQKHCLRVISLSLFLHDIPETIELTELHKAMNIVRLLSKMLD